MVLRALNEVEQGITACDAEAVLRSALAAAEAAATRGFRLSMVRRREGAPSHLDLPTAEQALVLSRSALANADAGLADAQMSLFKALGGGRMDSRETDGR